MRDTAQWHALQFPTTSLNQHDRVRTPQNFTGALAEHDRFRLNQLQRLHHSLRASLVFLELRSFQVRFVRSVISLGFGLALRQRRVGPSATSAFPVLIPRESTGISAVCVLRSTFVHQPLHPARKYIKMEAMQPFDRITWDPNQMNDQPCIRGMRLTVRRVVEAVAIYPNRDDLFRNYPDLEPEDVRQALAFAAASLEDSATESSVA